MMRLLSVVAVLLIIAVVVTPAGATYPIRYGYPTYSYVQPVIEQKVEVKRFTVLEYVPLYAVGFSPVQYAAPAAVYTQQPVAAVATTHTTCETKLAALDAKLAALEARLTVQGAAPVPQKAPATAREKAIADGLAVLDAQCAKCHTGATSKKKDGVPVVLFNKPGELAPEADVVLMMVAIEDDHMPMTADGEARPLSAEQKRTVRAMVKAASVRK